MLRVDEVLQVVGVSKSVLYEMIGRQQFPRPVRISLRAVGWRQRDIDDWLADGSVETVDVGQTTIRLEGKQFITTVIFAEEGEPNLLGVITLEDALLAVDPVTNELIPVVAKRYWPRFTLKQGPLPKAV